MDTPPTITGPQLYALTQRSSCLGSFECHWCSAPCTTMFYHDDLPNLPFIKSSHPSKRPANPYICHGCWLFRRRRITVTHLTSPYQDGQCPQKFSWWMTLAGAWIVDKKDYQALYDLLFKPPNLFSLSLIKPQTTNYLQIVPVNNISEIKGDTPLSFTVNNILHQYTVYELEQATLQEDATGREPGVRALFDFLGPPVVEDKPKLERGRPNEPVKTTKVTKKLVTMSGA